MQTPVFGLPRTVIVLGLVSFLNDTASEMITPLLPLFLTATLGAGPAVVGLIEGVAEATASLLKLLSGRLADRGWNHKRVVLGGYSVSNLARPLIGAALGWTWVLALRFLDRVEGYTYLAQGCPDRRLQPAGTAGDCVRPLPYDDRPGRAPGRPPVRWPVAGAGG